MNIVFAGTPDFALPSLDAVAASGHRLTGVLTQPDRPAGRGRRLAASPVKQRALELGVPVQQPERLKRDADIDALAALAPDLMVVVAYGLILPQRVLDLPTHPRRSWISASCAALMTLSSMASPLRMKPSRTRAGRLRTKMRASVRAFFLAQELAGCRPSNV